MSKIANALTWPFLPPDVKLQLRHRRLDAGADKRAGWALQIPDVAVNLVKAVDDADRSGRDPGMRLVPVPPNGKYPSPYLNAPFAAWYSHGAIEWDHQRVTVTGTKGSAVWAPDLNGLRPGFDAVEVFQARRRPTGSGHCLSGWPPSRPWASPATGFSGSCSSMPRHGISAGCRRRYFNEDDVIKFARAVGVPYRSYAFTLARVSSARVSPHALFEALFTQSARRVTFVSDEVNTGNDWFSDRKG